MDKILLINACVRPGSRTRQLAESVLKKLDGTVEEVRLDGTTLAALGPEGIELREQASQNGDFSDLSLILQNSLQQQITLWWPRLIGI